jgi:hypothetical protein
VNLQVSEIKRKSNEAQMREEFIPIPQYGRQSVCTLFVTLCEQKVSAYMPSWAQCIS